MEDAGLGIKGAAALKNTSVQQPLFIYSRARKKPEDASGERVPPMHLPAFLWPVLMPLPRKDQGGFRRKP
jgi:hypothetical protein